MDTERVNHPSHYGGEEDPYEAIKVIEAWGLGFNLGNTLKYISRAGKKGSLIEDLKKASWYLEREIFNRSKPEPADPVESSVQTKEVRVPNLPLRMEPVVRWSGDTKW